MEKSLKITSKRLLMAGAILVLIILIATCQWRAAEEQRRDEEIATAEGLVQVVTTAFSGKSDLRVSNIRGTIDVTSVNRGKLFDSKLKATLPFSVDYFVDLSKLGADDAKYDPQSRTLLIDVPDVRVAEPNVDLTKGKVGDAEGFWVSREASANLVRRALKLTYGQAQKTASAPEHLERARSEGRARVKALMEVPLEAAGLGDVNIVVQYPGDEKVTDPSYLDLSRTYNEVLEESRQNRR